MSEIVHTHYSSPCWSTSYSNQLNSHPKWPRPNNSATNQMKKADSNSSIPKTISISNVTRCEYRTRIQNPQTRCFHIPFAFTKQISRDVITLVLCSFWLTSAPFLRTPPTRHLPSVLPTRAPREVAAPNAIGS